MPGQYGMPPGPHGAPTREQRPEHSSPPRDRDRDQENNNGNYDDEKSEGVTEDIERFVRINRLESRCDQILRELSPGTARKVMGLDGGANTFELRGDVRNPTAVVIARVRKVRDAKNDSNHS